MTTEERIAIIKNKAKKDEDTKTAAKNEEIKEIDRLKSIILDMSNRIETLLVLANTCVDNGIEIPNDGYYCRNYNSAEKYGYPHEFIAEGIRHHTGLIRTWGSYTDGTYRYIGIENGGFCGNYDFWTDGKNIWAVNENNRNYRKAPRIEDMKKFIEEFPVFEKAFLNWIDSLEN